MANRYTARIYFDDEEVAQETGGSVEDLYNWMLTKAQGKFGNFNGEIIDNKTGAVVKGFRRSPPD